MDEEDEIPCHFKVDNYGAPAMWFVLSPSCNENQAVFNRNYSFEFCPLCQGRSRVFYCCDCISKGEFTHSNPRKPGVLSEKRIHFQLIEQRKEELAQKILQKVLAYACIVDYLAYLLRISSLRWPCFNLKLVKFHAQTVKFQAKDVKF